MITRSSFLPVCGVIDWLRSTSLSRFRPSGVISNAQAKTSTGSRPMTSTTMTSADSGGTKTERGEHSLGDLDQQPRDREVRGTDAQHIAPPEFADEGRTYSLSPCGRIISEAAGIVEFRPHTPVPTARPCGGAAWSRCSRLHALSALPSPRSVRQLERRILRTRSEAGALLRHVALDVGEDGLEFGFVADRGEIGIEVAVVAPQRAAPPGLLGIAKTLREPFPCHDAARGSARLRCRNQPSPGGAAGGWRVHCD